MKSVVTSPFMNASWAMTSRWNGMVVFTPSTVNSLRARAMRRMTYPSLPEWFRLNSVRILEVRSARRVTSAASWA